MNPSGLLILDKDPGPSSHAVVAAVRKRFGTRRVGHAGTLDPFASGVLVVLVGQATLLSQFLVLDDKEYHATLRWGFETDTLDRTGTSTISTDALVPTDEQINDVLPRFVGEFEQVPPAFSAKKVDGRALYRLARKGQAVEPEAVRVRVDELRLAGHADDRIDLFVRCGKGTYIRSLARDIGRSLGGAAHLAELRRTRSGPFVIDQAVKLGDIATEAESVSLIPMDRALPHLPRLELDEARAVDAVHGRVIPLDEPASNADGPIALYDCGGSLLAVGSPVEDGRMIRVRRVFHDAVEYRARLVGTK